MCFNSLTELFTKKQSQCMWLAPECTGLLQESHYESSEFKCQIELIIDMSGIKDYSSFLRFDLHMKKFNLVLSLHLSECLMKEDPWKLSSQC